MPKKEITNVDFGIIEWHTEDLTDICYHPLIRECAVVMSALHTCACADLSSEHILTQTLSLPLPPLPRLTLFLRWNKKVNTLLFSHFRGNGEATYDAWRISCDVTTSSLYCTLLFLLIYLNWGYCVLSDPKLYHITFLNANGHNI